ncbi:MAG: hypothetical protein KJ955_01655 [Nanoarchaeota archaeon]|nr:hypothetical protein [Nanoarchaeota archaeon]
MISKKAIAPIIAFVLLMGMAVALGAFVTIWYTRASEKQTTELIGKFGTEEECSGVGFDVAFDYDPAGCSAEIYNLGSFTIDKVKADAYYLDGSETHDMADVDIIPRTGVAIELPLSLIARLQFSPILEEKGSLTQCLNERVFVPEVPVGITCA